MSNAIASEPRYILAIVQSGTAHAVAESNDLDDFLPRINLGGRWTVWERGEAGTSRIAYFEVDVPMRLIRSGNARCLEDRWRRGPRGVYQSSPVVDQQVTRADLDAMIARGRDALAEIAGS